MMNIEAGLKKPAKFSRMKTNRIVGRVATYAILTVLSVIWLYPILWIVLNAFRVEYNGAILMTDVVPHYFPKSLGFENFALLFTSTDFPTWFLNTLIVATCSCVLSTMLNLTTSYVMSKLRFRGRKAIMNIAMVLGLFPGFMSMIAIYYILKAFGLTGSLFALILCYSATAGMGFYIGKGFFDTIPNALVESARLDGATSAQIFTRIVLPLSKPIIIYTALLAFTGPWMDFIFARVILGADKTELHTVAIGLYYMVNKTEGDNSGFTKFAAGCVCVAVPIVALFLSMQKYYIEGTTAGAVKG